MRENYYNNNKIYEFETEVVETEITNTEQSLIQLAGTYFYPEGGGQPADKGTINGLKVLDVQKINGKVQHTVDGIINLGPATCVIDKQHRDHYMVQHTGQHLISAVLKHELDIDTLSVHLGQETTTIEINRTGITENEIAQLEDAIYKLITSNKKVIYHETDDEGLQNFNIRRSSKYSGYIRVVEIEDYDCVPCGGVHLSNLSEVGLVKISGYEKIRGHIRLICFIGENALLDYRDKNYIINGLNRDLSTTPDLILDGVASLKKNIYDLKLEKKSLTTSYSKLLLHNIKRDGTNFIEFNDMPTSFTKHLAGDLKSNIAEPILIIYKSENINWYIIDSKKSKIDFQYVKKEILPIISGKGGGSNGLWQGSGNSQDTPAFIKAFLDYLNSVN